MGLNVYSPKQIKNWEELFIVITTKYKNEVESKLSELGLLKDTDYIFYKDYFCAENNINKSLNNISNYIQPHLSSSRRTLIFAPFFTCRQKEIMTNFFKRYFEFHNSEHHICIGALDAISEEKASEAIGARVLNLADIVLWDGTLERYELCKKSITNEDILLTKEEKALIEKVENRKTSFDYVKSLELTEYLYNYLKQIIKIIKPQKVVIWGGWTRTSYLLAAIAQKEKIKYGFMEYGWIPGTFQFDKCGIAGQSEYAISNKGFSNYKKQIDHDKINKVKEYIIKNKIDTGIFKITDNDKTQLKKLIPNTKTVFFVGMGDIEMGMNPYNKYWKRYISNIVFSQQDIFVFIRNLCIKNNWNYIYKPHPHSRTSEEEKRNRYDKNVIYISDMSIDYLIEKSDVVISIASAVDYKVLIYNKPLISLGKTGFTRKNIAYDIKDKEDIEKIIKVALQNGQPKKKINNFIRFLDYLLNNNLWDDLSHLDLPYGLSFDRDFFES